MSKKVYSGRFLGRILGPLLKTGLPLIKNLLKPSAKSVLIPLGLTAVALSADGGIREKVYGSGMATLIISKKQKRIFWHVIRYISTNLLGNLLTRKGIKAKIPGQEAIRAGEGVIRAGQDF